MEDFDSADALERVDNDLDFLDELVLTCKEDYPVKMEQILVAIQNNDPKTASELAHSIKSGLGNLGAKKAHQAAKELEYAGKNGEITELPRLLENLKVTALKFFAVYQEFRKKSLSQP